MNLIEKIRSQPRGVRVRFIWIVCIITFILLIVLWIFTSRIGKTLPKDTSLFQTIGQGLKDIRDSYKK